MVLYSSDEPSSRAENRDEDVKDVWTQGGREGEIRWDVRSDTDAWPRENSQRAGNSALRSRRPGRGRWRALEGGHMYTQPSHRVLQQKPTHAVKQLLIQLLSFPVMSNAETPWNAAHQASLTLTISQSSHPLPPWCHPAISSSDALFSFCPQSLPASGTFPMSQLFASDDQNTGASTSASFVPTSIQGWFPLRLTCSISLQSKGVTKCQ